MDKFWIGVAACVIVASIILSRVEEVSEKDKIKERISTLEQRMNKMDNNTNEKT